MKRPKIEFMQLGNTTTEENLNRITNNINGLINRVNDLEEEKSKRENTKKYVLIIELITFILTILKLTNAINCSWLLVLSPLILMSIVMIFIVNVIILFKKK